MSRIPKPNRKRLDPLLEAFAKLGEGPPPDWIGRKLDRWDREARRAGFLELALQNLNVDSSEGAPDDSGNQEKIAPALIGQIVDQWRLLRLVGHGGFGDVYEAVAVSNECSQNDRRYALKIYHPERVGTESRLEIERLCLQSMEHPHLVSAVGKGTTSGGEPYLVMDYVEGLRIDDYVHEHRLGYVEIARMFATVAEAMAHAHSRDILHRDLKPGNILVKSGDNPVVVDFGLAKRLNSIDERSLTTSGTLMGTLAYLSPEQADPRNREITRRTDIYGLGATLYRVLTDETPIDAPDLVTTLFNHRDQTPRPLRALQPSIPRDLELICLKCLGKDPLMRYPSMEELASDLRRFAEGKPVKARGLRPSERVHRWCRNYPKTALFSLLFALTILTALTTTSVLLRRVSQRQTETLRLLDLTRRSLEFEDRTAESMLAQTPETLAFRHRRLTEAVLFIDAVVEAFPNDDAILQQSAVTYFRLGQVAAMRELFGESTKAYQIALERFQELSVRAPADISLKFDIYHSLMGLYNTERGESYDQINLDYLSDALDLIKHICEIEPSNHDYRDALACTTLLWAGRKHHDGRLDEAQELVDLAWTTAVALKSEIPVPSQKWRHTGCSANRQARLALDRNDLIEARKWLEIAKAETREFVEREPLDLPGELLDWSHVLKTAAEIELADNNLPAAAANIEEARLWVENGIRRFPDHPYFKTQLLHLQREFHDLLPPRGESELMKQQSP